MLSVVPLPSRSQEDMLAWFDTMRDRLAAGEFDSIWFFGWTPDGKFLTLERGKRQDKIVKIGALECFKQDLINSMEVV